jgi:lycopene cyclase domain-containing protein
MSKCEKLLFCLVPFIFCGIAIVLPVYLRDMSYAASMVVLFFIPVAIMLIINWRWMEARHLLKPFLYANLVMDGVAFFFEYVSIGMKVWWFSQEHHKLLGINIIDLPIEEFMFWFGATPFCILLYICFYRILHCPKKLRVDDRVIFSIWAMLAFVFLPVAKKLYHEIKTQYGDKNIFSWRAIIGAVAVFWFVMTFVEHHSIACKHWVFNKDRIWGLYFWKIPVEEFIFYTLGPIFTVLLLHIVELEPGIRYKNANITRRN